MQVQATLENKQLPIQERLWKGFCCARCYRAKSDKKRCRCRCHGTHHGEQRLRVLEKAEKEELNFEPQQDGYVCPLKGKKEAKARRA